MKTQIFVLTLCATLSAAALAAAQEAPVAAPIEAPPANPPSAAPVVPAPAPASPIPSADKAPSSVSATSPSREETARRGFLLRMQLGGGYRSASSGVGSTGIDVSGSGIGLSVLAGGAVAEGLFLCGEVLADYATNPTIEVGTQKKGIANNTSMRFVGFGPGITYLMPGGFHLGGTVLLARMTIEQNDQEIGSTDMGFGAVARVGKDFWLGEHHALGIVGQFMFASMDDKPTTATTTASTFSTTAFTLALSGTYN